ncbi:MAG: hypothetical protein ACFB4I_09775 [Cyanophyceae cyanobacterium]
MARYTCSYTTQTSFEDLQPSLVEILQTCNFETIYQTSDYMMAQEVPGQVSFTKLVTVEVLIDATAATSEEILVNLVVKNEELALQLNNHCQQMFELIQKSIAENCHWQLVELTS